MNDGPGRQAMFRCYGVELVKTDIVRASGCHIVDAANKEYLDFEAGVWCAALGHSHPRIVQVMHAQIDELIHLGLRYTNPVVEAAAAAVLEKLAMPDAKCMFLSSGSEAVELAVGMARKVTGRPLLLVLSDSYLAAYGSAGERRPDEWRTVDWAGCTRCPNTSECDPACQVVKEIPFQSIGAFVFEPGSSSGLIRFPPPQLVRFLSRRVREEQGLIVIDEVTTGFGRTGAWFGYVHYGLQPDLVALGKGLGNGYPVSSVAMTAAVAESLREAGFHHSQSHQDDPLGCAIAKEVVAVLGEEKLIERSARVGASFLDGVRVLAERNPATIKEVRGRGLMIAIEFQADGPIPLESVYRELLRRGFVAGYKPAAHLLRFYPPLTMPDGAVAGLIENLGDILEGTP